MPGGRARRPAPAQQGLEADDVVLQRRAAAQLRDRLPDQMEGLGCHRRQQLRLQRLTPGNIAVQAGGEVAQAGTAAPLRVIEGEMGAAQQRLRIRGVVGSGGKSDRAADRKGMALEGEGRLHRLHQPVRDEYGVRCVVQLRQQDDELVAAKSGGDIPLPQRAPDAPGNLAQQRIAGGETMCRIDELEMVDADADQAAGGGFAATDQLVQMQGEIFAAEQSGQPVMVDMAGQLGSVPVQFQQ